MITVGSLFSGIGGIELGLERTGGFKTIWFCENDPYASAVLKKHWPDVPNHADITKVDWNDVEKPDMLTGGFPCQDISVAGKGKGIKEGTRSGLWKEYALAIRILRPKLALIENVPMLAKRGLNIVLADLASMGYDAEWFLLSAAQTGAWHKRERLFILAYPNSQWELQPKGSIENIRRRPGDSSKAIPYSQSIGREQPGPTRAGRDGPENTHSDVSDAMRSRRGRRDTETQPEQENDAKVQGRGSASSIPNAQSIGIQGDGTYREQITRLQALEGLSRRNCARNRGEIWKAEPGLGRVADGIPNRVDRIKCLGNAVVPQVAETIGYWILERDVVNQ